jgi:hypothetical protein
MVITKLLRVNHIKEMINMWEYGLRHRETDKEEIIFGYSLMDAFRRSPALNPDDWECVRADYID